VSGQKLAAGRFLAVGDQGLKGFPGRRFQRRVPAPSGDPDDALHRPHAVARAHVRGLAALPSNSASDEARVLAVRTAKAALAFHPQWRDEPHGDCALAGSFAVLTLLQGDGVSVSDVQRQVEELRGLND
jgi:hypothetical protein